MRAQQKSAWRMAVLSTCLSAAIMVAMDGSVPAAQAASSDISANIAPTATATASSEDTADGSLASKAIDRIVDGYPNGGDDKEWSLVSGRTGWIRLTFPAPVAIDHVVLHDRINLTDQVTGSNLTFSAGASVQAGSLPNNGRGKTVAFSTRSVSWVQLNIAAGRASTYANGLAEFEVWGTTTATSASAGSGVPADNLPGWRQTFVEDFTRNAPLGSFGSIYGQDWRGYSGFGDTNGNGQYAPDKVLSVSGGILDYYLHTENGQHLVATAIPMGYDGQTYGRYSIRFRSDNIDGYKIAFLLWPSSDNWNEGEIDWPEGDLAGVMSPASALKGSMTPQGMRFDPPTRAYSATDSTGWHVATTEWTRGLVRWLWDGVEVGRTTIPTGVPTTPMRWTLQAETSTPQPSASSAGHLQVDWVTAYALR